MSAARAIIFDLDDTLYPEREYAFSGFEAVAEFMTGGAAPLVKAPAAQLVAPMRRLFDTADRGRVFDRVLEDAGMSPDDARRWLPRVLEVFRRHRPRIRLHPDADAALARLRGGCKLGIISDGYSVAQHAKIDALGVRDRVDEIIVTDDWGREFWKPHRRAFEEMSVRLGVPHAACTYVADNPAKDFVAPNQLGWRSVFLRRADGVHTDKAAPPGGEPQETITSCEML